MDFTNSVISSGAFLLLLANLAVTYKGFKDPVFNRQYVFHIAPIFEKKEYYRLITSGFLHGDWWHFAINMLTLTIFASGLEAYLGMGSFFGLYFVSLIGGSLLSLYLHRNHPDYSALGASGAVSGIVFASIGLFPGMELGLLFVPIYLPAWLFGLLFVVYSAYGIVTQHNNIGHGAHLGGGITGLLVAIFMEPELLGDNYWTVLIVLVPALAVLYLIMTRPHLLLIDWSAKRSGGEKYYTLEDRHNASRAARRQELDQLLVKVKQKGLKGLSEKERKRLTELSQQE